MKKTVRIVLLCVCAAVFLFKFAAADAGLQEIDILYKPVLNEFRGKISVEAQVTALRPSK